MKSNLMQDKESLIYDVNIMFANDLVIQVAKVLT